MYLIRTSRGLVLNHGRAVKAADRGALGRARYSVASAWFADLGLIGPKLPKAWFDAFTAAGGVGEYSLFPGDHGLFTSAPQLWQLRVLEFLRSLGYPGLESQLAVSIGSRTSACSSRDDAVILAASYGWEVCAGEALAAVRVCPSRVIYRIQG
jgi:hypothetical protein